MIDLIKIKEYSLEVVNKYHKTLVDVITVFEYGIHIIRIIIDDPNTFDIDIDEVALINNELLDLVNDLIPDDYYLEVTSVGIERELIDENDYFKAIGKYVYVSCYEKLPDIKIKEFYGDLVAYDNGKLTINVKIKNRQKEIEIEKIKIAKIRLAVKF